jgi:hypothetical protein
MAIISSQVAINVVAGVKTIHDRHIYVQHYNVEECHGLGGDNLCGLESVLSRVNSKKGRELLSVPK